MNTAQVKLNSSVSIYFSKQDLPASSMVCEASVKG